MTSVATAFLASLFGIVAVPAPAQTPAQGAASRTASGIELEQGYTFRVYEIGRELDRVARVAEDATPPSSTPVGASKSPRSCAMPSKRRRWASDRAWSHA